jgi:glycosyltransferase involved in cell wall biosynthesis
VGSAATRRARAIGVVLKGYPRLSETFITQELIELERRGFRLALFSLRHPTDRHTHPLHDQVRAQVTYLPEYLHEGLKRVLRGWRRARRLPGYAKARAAWLLDLRRDFTRNRIRRFGQAMVLAAELRDDVVHLHAHFMHTPASVARYAAMMRDIGWSCSAHAKDIWTIPEWEKREKLAHCTFTATCTSINANHLRTLADAAARVDLVYHGIDTARFPPPIASDSARNGSRADAPVELLSVGRAVDKKGLDDLLHALALLPRTLHWRFVHIGDGPLLAALANLAQTLGIHERIEWRGAQAHADVLAAYRTADIFVLPCRISADGDRDGLPNVLLEAQSQRLVCVSTSVSGIPELIIDGVTGVLVNPRDRDALSNAIAQLIVDPQRRRTIGDAGFMRTTTSFSLKAGADALAARFAQTLAVA